MKKIVVSLAALALLSSAVTSCKKGDGDPFLSLKSRKARVAGEWKATKMEDKSNTTSSSTSGGTTTTTSSTADLKLEGDKITLNITQTDQNGSTTTITVSGTGQLKATFEKDGNYSTTFVFNGNGTASSQGISIDLKLDGNGNTTGTWTFLNGVEKDYKNKERMIMNVLSEKEKNTQTATIPFLGSVVNVEEKDNTYLTGENTETWLLGTLKSKLMEVSLAGKSTAKVTNTQTAGGNSTVSSSTETTEYTRTITLEQ